MSTDLIVPELLENFAFMLERRPGNVMLIGNGAMASLHEVAYGFNDDASPHGIAYWVKLAETLMPSWATERP